MQSRILGVIPARLGSTRLPNKPLYPVLGRPLIEWVWRRAAEMRILDAVVVATDSEEIVKVCRRIGADVALTSPDHRSGTDRVAEVARQDAYRDCSIVVNIQGDEPLLREDHVASAVALVRDGGWQIGTCAFAITEPDVMRDPSVVKVVRAESGRALYFSRSPIPFDRDGESHGPGGAAGLGHVGLYVYDREALAAWVALKPSPLERREKLEQLRPLEADMAIGIAVVEEAEAGIDTPDDVARVEKRLRDTNESSHLERAQR